MIIIHNIDKEDIMIGGLFIFFIISFLVIMIGSGLIVYSDTYPWHNVIQYDDKGEIIKEFHARRIEHNKNTNTYTMEIYTPWATVTRKSIMIQSDNIAIEDIKKPDIEYIN